jgi:hypothetical protein
MMMGRMGKMMVVMMWMMVVEGDGGGVCVGGECVVRSGYEEAWAEEAIGTTFRKLRIEGDVEVSGDGVGRTTLRGVAVVGDGGVVSGMCPVFKGGKGSSFTNVSIHCLNPPKAGIWVQGSGVTIDGVTTTGGSPVFDAAKRDGDTLDIKGMVIKDVETDGDGEVVGIIGNALGGVTELSCRSSQYVIVQPVQGYRVAKMTMCNVIDIGELVGLYGVEYEIMYDDGDAYEGATGSGEVLHSIIEIEVGVIVVSVVGLIIYYQDTAYLMYQRGRLKPGGRGTGKG